MHTLENMMNIKRKIYDKLLQWKNTVEGKSALLVVGARRVGKSYIVKKFAEQEYRSHILIDFNNVSDDILDIFKNDRGNMDLFFQKLSVVCNTKLHVRNSLIIFDEVQLFPTARQFIKYLVADGRYDYIETGSLLSIRYNAENILLPSEEEELEMHPLDFEEFLWAKGNSSSVDLLRDFFEKRQSLGQAAHRTMMNEFRTYMLIGGMPQAVLQYVETGDFDKTNRVKRGILRLYKDDIARFAEKYKGKVRAVFDEIPEQLTRKEKKFKLASISKEARFREYEDAFMWLIDAKVVNPCFKATEPSVGLRMNRDQTSLKCYSLDTGLLVSQVLDTNTITSNEIYKAILFERIGINEGMFAENIIAQMLVANGKKLYFYSCADKRKKENTMEIDFLIQEGKRISPIEVKSGAYRGHSSLDKFKVKFGTRVGTRYVLHTQDLKVEGDIVYLPLYMAMFL